MDRDQLSERLEAFMASQFDAPVRVEALAPMPGGASRQIYSFDLRLSDRPAPLPLVLRMDPEPGPLPSDRTTEYRLLLLAARHGVTVPRVHCLGGREHGLPGSFLVMDRVAGQAVARPLLRDPRYAQARTNLPGQLARELARIHSIDVGDADLAALAAAVSNGDGRRFARAEVARYRASLGLAAAGQPHPVLALAARWLEQHAPYVSRPALVHGDFRVGNILYDERGLTAVLDWELAHVGDPIEDLGWLCVQAWRFGNDALAAGGLCSREELWRLYERESGMPVDPASALYWELFGNWKWAIICIMQASGYRAGSYPSLELASLGRRVAEVEWELLELLGRVGGARDAR